MKYAIFDWEDVVDRVELKCRRTDLNNDLVIGLFEDKIASKERRYWIYFYIFIDNAPPLLNNFASIEEAKATVDKILKNANYKTLPNHMKALL